MALIFWKMLSLLQSEGETNKLFWGKDDADADADAALADSALAPWTDGDEVAEQAEEEDEDEEQEGNS